VTITGSRHLRLGSAHDQSYRARLTMTKRLRASTAFSILSTGCMAMLAWEGCATSPPPPPKPAPAPVVAPAPTPPAPVEPTFAVTDGARAGLVGSVVVAAPEKVVADLDALSKRLSLPMMLGRELMTALGHFVIGAKDAQLKSLLDRLDPSTHLAVVWILPPGSTAKGFCAALTFKDGEAARTTFAEMGTKGAERDGLSERRTVTGDVLWGGVKGRTLFVSGSAEALLLAGGLAEAAQAEPIPGQMVATVLPPALMKASGKTRDAIVAELSANMTNGMKAANGKETPAFKQMLSAMMAEATKLALDSSSARIVLDINARDGLLLRSELVPIPGTDFAARAAKTAAYEVDPRLPVRDDRTAVVAVGDLSSWLSLAAAMFESSGPAGRALWRDMSKLFAGASSWSCVFDAGEVGFSTLCSAPLAKELTGKAALDAAVAMMKSQNAWEAELEGRKPSAMKIKRKGEVVEIEKKIEAFDPNARAMAVAMAGGDTIRTAFMIKDGHLLEAVGPDARKTLARYGAGRALEDSPLVAQALSMTKGDDAVASVDVVAFLLHVLGKAKELPGSQMVAVASALPGMVDMKAPFLFALRSGRAVSLDFRIPLRSLEGVAGVVRGMLGDASAPAP
jgi:hypothetical protein